MKTQKGFIQIPLLIAIIAGVLVLGGAGYWGIKQYQNHQAKISTNKNNQSTTTPELSEVEKLKQEVEELKKQSTQNQDKVSATTKDIAVISTGKKSVLTNAQIIAKIKPATVYISTQTAVGSGMIFSSDGYVLTNAHVVKGATDVDVSLSTGTKLVGTVIGRNEIADLAVIKLDTTKQLPKVEFGDSDKVQQGDNVFTFGFPFGIEGDVSFKEGTISRRIESYFETSAEIHPGNSGGPLVDRFGQIIGINIAIYGKTISGIQLGETIKLAIPINVAKSLVEDLKLGKNVLEPISPSTNSTKENNLCADIQTEFDDFSQKYDKILSKFSEVIKMYHQANMAPSSLSGISIFRYLYSQTVAEKDAFVRSSEDLQDFVSRIQILSQDKGNILSLLKSNFISSTIAFINSYNLNIEAYKVLIGVLSDSAFDTSKALLENGNTSYVNAGESIVAGKNNFNSLKEIYNRALIKNNCNKDMPPVGSIINIKQSVETAISINSGLTCQQFGYFSESDRKICNLYRNYREYYKWIIVNGQ